MYDESKIDLLATTAVVDLSTINSTAYTENTHSTVTQRIRPFDASDVVGKVVMYMNRSGSGRDCVHPTGQY